MQGFSKFFEKSNIDMVQTPFRWDTSIHLQHWHNDLEHNMALVNLHQSNDESLWSFMEGYATILVKIKDLDPGVALHSMITALKPGPFSDSISKKQPRDLDELRAQVAGSSKWRNYYNFATKIRSREQKKGESSRKDKFKPIQDKSFKRSSNRLPKYGHYTLLNVSWACLLEEAFYVETLCLPLLARLVNSTYWSKHCRYHQNYGHTTEECVALKDKIEEFILEGALNNYIYNPNNNMGGYKG